MLSGVSDLASRQPIYKGGGHGRLGTTERDHVLEKFGKHSSTALEQPISCKIG